MNLTGHLVFFSGKSIDRLMSLFFWKYLTEIL